jgi:hypothetical protein
LYQHDDTALCDIAALSTPIAPQRMNLLRAIANRPPPATLPGMPDFVTLALVANCSQVVLPPLLAGDRWRITASARCMGEAPKNRLWENAVMALFFGLAVHSAAGSAVALFRSAARR